MKEGYTALAEKYDVTFPPEGTESFTYDEVYDMLPEYDVLQSVFSFKVDRALLERGDPRLKLVCNYAVGYDNIDIVAAGELGIAVANTPDPVTEPTAELAFGLITAVARRISPMDRLIRDKGAIRRGLLDNLGYTLTGKTLGIVGMGRIGQAIARRARAFGMDVVYFNRHRLDVAVESRYDAEYRPLDELLSTSDVISINVPYSADTHHLIGAEQFALMKPSAIFVNTSRGPIVDEKALAGTLKEHRIFGAGLDVYEFDDTPSADLLKLDNVVLTPHLGTQTYDTRIEMALCVSRNIVNFFEGGPVSLVTKI